MLVLSRKAGEGIVIRTEAGDVIVTATQITGGRCRLGIKAPDEVRILRTELDRGKRLGENLRRFFGTDNQRFVADEDVREFAEWVGPRCSHCREPVNAHNGIITSGLRQTWLCDSCAAACEDDADARREQRRYDP